jgi:hypothetical protein
MSTSALNNILNKCFCGNILQLSTLGASGPCAICLNAIPSLTPRYHCRGENSPAHPNCLNICEDCKKVGPAGVRVSVRPDVERPRFE